ncbi:MAG TPA: tetratricopeptide repeat protein [Candidatus Polarisedimenticolia bacterium]|nr:tetratricopeptide repeat protein [Candidatus Polarisedimenticolia bacterium]
MRWSVRLTTILLAAALAAAAPQLAQAVPRAGASSEHEAAADRAFANDDYEAAETGYRRAIAASPDSAHALSRLALLLTWKGQYAEAIALYERALAGSPSSLEVRRGLATALTWSEDYPRAIALYEAMLGERPGDEALTVGLAEARAWSGDLRGAARVLEPLLERQPRHLKALVLLGQVRLWDGRLAGAEAAFARALAVDPDDAAALNGMARVEAARGDYDEALARYDRILARDPRNRQALEGRAEALHWQGRAPEALSAVKQALELYPDARDARRLGRDIGGPLRPSLQLFASSTQDSDDNDLAQWGALYTHHLGGRGHVGFSFAHAQTEATLGLDTPVARHDTLKAVGGWHVSRVVSLYGELGGERISLAAGEQGVASLAGETRERLAGSATVELNPAAWLTLVGSVSQEALVGTTQAFMNDVGIRAATATVIVRPRSSLRFRLMGQRASFTDDDRFDVDSSFTVLDEGGEENSRTLATAGVTWRVPLGRPRLHLSYTARWMSYEEQLDQGYFDPKHYVSHLAGFDLSDSVGRRFYWGAGADAGVQVIDGGFAGMADTHDNVLSVRLLAGFNLGESLAIEAYHSRSDLAAQTAAGFRSIEAGLRLKLRFGPVLGPAAPGRGTHGGGSGAGD